MHLPSQLKTNELVPSIIQKNIHIFLSEKKEKDIRNVCTNYPFQGVQIVEGSAQREVVSGGKKGEERKSPPSLQSFPGSLYFVPWVPEVFTPVRRGASFRRPQADTCSAKGRRHER